MRCTMGRISRLYKSTFVWMRLEKYSFRLWKSLEYAQLPRRRWRKTRSNEKPAHSGSLWHNYKDYFSSSCYSLYNFTAINIGDTEATRLLNSRIGRKFDQNRFNIRPPETLYRFDEMVPFFLVGDEIFPVKE